MKAVKPNDIRLGNWLKYSPDEKWVKDIHNQPVQADLDILIEVASAYRHGDIPEPYLPIELSPEILEKAGFVSNRWGGWMLHLYDRDYLMCGVNMDVYIDKPTIDQDGTWYDFDVHVVECKYVHQLQNLYFALTNQPLKIEL